jgi:hypothetical protein
VEGKMRKWFFFLFFTVLIGFFNEWTKLNVNFFIELSKFKGWKQADDQVRSDLYDQQFEKKNSLYYHQLVKCPECVGVSERVWVVLKWTIPIFFTLLFFLLELFFLNKLFPHFEIKRRHVFFYYLFISGIVFFLFFLFKLSGVKEFQIVSRKIWIVLQGPSLFVLLWVYQLIKKNESIQN